MQVRRANAAKAAAHPALDAGGLAADREAVQQAVASSPPFALRLRLGERRWLLFLGDVLTLLASGTAAVAFWAYLRPDARLTTAFLAEQASWVAALGLAWLLLCALFGGYDLRAAADGRQVTQRLLATALVFGTVYLVLFYVLSKPPPLLRAAYPALRAVRLLRVLPTLFVSLAFAGELAWRNAYARLLTGARFQRPTLIIGAGWAGVTIARALAEYGDGSYRVLGFVDDDPAKLHTVVPVFAEHPSSSALTRDQPPPSLLLRVLGSRWRLRDLIAELDISTLILAITHESDGSFLPILIDCLELGVEIIPMPILYEQLTGRVPVEHVGDNWYVAMPIEHPGTGAAWPLVKRLVDIIAAVAGLALCALIIPPLALAILIDDRGPIFYTQQRVGRSGSLFTVYKLRSMVVNAEDGDAVWAQSSDPRVTRVGRFLRQTHLDELPQFLNILRGEMSLVGPRPERPEFVDQLVEELPFYRVRHAVRPGAAGWALVNQGYGASNEDALLKLQYDLYYIKHQSPWVDLSILLKTAASMLKLRGR